MPLRDALPDTPRHCAIAPRHRAAGSLLALLFFACGGGTQGGGGGGTDGGGGGTNLAANGAACKTDTECKSALCYQGRCLVVNRDDCAAPTDCVSGACAGGTCQGKAAGAMCFTDPEHETVDPCEGFCPAQPGRTATCCADSLLGGACARDTDCCEFSSGYVCRNAGCCAPKGVLCDLTTRCCNGICDGVACP